MPLLEEKKELMKRIIQISDSHGGSILREHSYFSPYQPSDSAAAELRRARDYARFSTQSSTSLNRRYASLKPQQKELFDITLNKLDRKASLSLQNQVKKDGKVFFLQVHAGTGNINLLSLLRDMVDPKGWLTEITEPT